MSVTIHHGDSREILKVIPDASIHSVVTDPPYALVATLKRFKNSPRSESTELSAAGPYARTGRGFMGQKWDTGETAFDPTFWAEVLRVLKPGGHVVAFGGTRTYHRLACAIEDAGFEIRDQIAWLYGSGFPKSHDVSKGIDKALGAERRVVSKAAPVKRMIPGADQHKGGWEKNNGREFVPTVTAAGSPEAADWEGWGTALKPALEPIVLARKPLDGTVAANVLAHGTGALNIDQSRIAGGEGGARTGEASELRRYTEERVTSFSPTPGPRGGDAKGRWPANVIHDGSEEVARAFPESDGGGDIHKRSAPKTSGVYGQFAGDDDRWAGYADTGSAARFFYAAEPDNLCGLCRCPSASHSTKLSACDANTAEPSSPTRSTPRDDTAHCDAAASQPPALGVKSPASNDRAPGAETRSSRRRQTASDTADALAPTPDLSSLAQNVRSAASLCASCATAIAQSLAATRRGHDPASLQCPASIAARNWQILISNLALYVAGREHTDTITTTENLRTLLGSVLHAIGATTNSARAVRAASIDPDQRRFHYSSKADAEDRLGSKHPTVKPVDLMAYLCRLVTPPAGVVLDPFAGTGTTGLAAMREGFDSILIEREAEYVADIHRRVAWATGEGRLTIQEMSRKPDESADALPLFAGTAA